ncbi:MAG: aminodeoxychorismate synthase component I [Desulfobacterales bacterium]|nr:aminodeoxychorismate synthase component I [Desulfobacterales bacterium]
MNNIKNILNRIDRIHIEDFALEEPFVDFAARFAHMPGTVALMSGGDLDCAGYHILAAKPWLTFSGRKRNMTVRSEDQTRSFEADPFDALRSILDAFDSDHLQLPEQIPIPVAAGLFGYLSYDLKDCIESLPRTSMDDLELPHIKLFAPSIVVVQDRQNSSTCLCIPERIIAGQSTLDNDRKTFERIITSPPLREKYFSGDAGGFRSNFKKPDYIDSVKKIREYIASGHVYQVNMSQRFQMDFKGDPFHLFETLYKKNPAPFFAFINAGDHQIVSTSPERFIQRTGKRVETRPIKGTRPRGKTPSADRTLRNELKQSEKDDAELSMIVDLLRNDLGKVCVGGSVRVSEHKRLEAYENVYHLVSVVEGELKNDCDSVDLITATFPGGSITGCPKIRSMEIIDELEPNRRHIYTGSIGYMSFYNTMDLSIAIRTATIYKGKIIFSVGGGIVYDSDPFDEFDETMHKGQTLISVFEGEKVNASNGPHVWINGNIVAQERAGIPVSDLGFQYGFGFFETIRVEKSEARYLGEHVKRFNQTWKDLFATEPPDLTWDKIIDQVIIQNGLQEDTAALKIIATRGDSDTPPFNHTLIVMARQYTHRLGEIDGPGQPGLNLITYPEPRRTPLADHKTLNYLYYFLAGKWAKDRGADEALITNPDGTVSETNSANILLFRGRIVTRPVSPHVLPGIMENAILRLLTEWGYRIEKETLGPGDLFSADEAMISNSLIGAVPILSLDGKRLAAPSDLWKKINEVVL